jgi:hypothetical protein
MAVFGFTAVAKRLAIPLIPITTLTCSRNRPNVRFETVQRTHFL